MKLPIKIYIIFGFLFKHTVSIAVACVAVANFPAENIAEWTWTTSATGPNCLGRLYHCVWCYVGPMRAIAIVEPLLFARLCDSILVCRQIVACTCYTWPVSNRYLCICISILCILCVFFLPLLFHVCRISTIGRSVVCCAKQIGFFMGFMSDVTSVPYFLTLLSCTHYIYERAISSNVCFASCNKRSV